MTHISIRKDYWIDWETGIITINNGNPKEISWIYGESMTADNIIIK